ncbi:predicted protein [Naegleria gruberi]|uniref:Predicted protein n=1 Tax=Naegleria gruberi TaxID=5762 RepID=D2V8X3_NAEGR|nr:uncharacterized protein NAEGRDRAFT_65315 [Naegleria gruberi]EFC46877.1 predicted protein [Naegleria gruberi]|eukprot:XP_002679621.1 predicted protein [Naegleria gruberi strain NEG-M]
MSISKVILLAIVAALLVTFAVASAIPSDAVIESILGTFEKEYEMSDAISTASPAAVNAARFAQQQVGKCYSQQNRLGNPCFDCSGLVYTAYKSQGKTVPTSTGVYPNGNIYEVTGQPMEVGDILFRPGHVGIYVGGNQVVSAENSRTGVRQRDMGYYSAYLKFTKVYRVR